MQAVFRVSGSAHLSSPTSFAQYRPTIQVEAVVLIRDSDQVKPGLSEDFFLSSLIWQTNFPGEAERNNVASDAADYVRLNYESLMPSVARNRLVSSASLRFLGLRVIAKPRFQSPQISKMVCPVVKKNRALRLLVEMIDQHNVVRGVAGFRVDYSLAIG
jgi:hypothetical protein